MAEVDVTNKRIFCRSSHPGMFCKKGVLEYLENFIGKHQYKSLFLKEVWGCRPATLFQKRLMYRFFSVKCLKLFRTAFLYYTCESLVNLRKISEKTTSKSPALLDSWVLQISSTKKFHFIFFKEDFFTQPVT